MKKLYSLFINDKYVSVLLLEEKDGHFSLIKSELIGLDELAENLDPKIEIYLCTTQEYSTELLIDVPTVIKNKKNIDNYILHKLKSQESKRNYLFRFEALPSSDDENQSYSVYAIDEEEYEKTLQQVPKWENITKATLDKFALFCISEQCLRGYTYISTYTYDKKILIIAVEESKLLFYRTSTINAPTPEAMIMEMTSEINQTINYIQQQHRDLNFSVVALSGMLSLDDQIPEQLIMFNALPVAVLYPNTFISNIEQEEAQANLLALGNLYTPKEFLFFPKKLLGLKEYLLTTKILLIAASFLFIFTLLLSSSKYMQYQDTLQEYNTLYNRVNSLMQTTKLLKEEKLKKTLLYLQVTKKNLYKHPVDTIVEFKTLLTLITPKSWLWEEKDGKVSLKAEFEKSFSTLKELYEFQEEFDHIVADINNGFPLENKKQINYKKLLFVTTLQTPTQQTRHPKTKRRGLRE